MHQEAGWNTLSDKFERVIGKAGTHHQTSWNVSIGQLEPIIRQAGTGHQEHIFRRERSDIRKSGHKSSDKLDRVIRKAGTHHQTSWNARVIRKTGMCHQVSLNASSDRFQCFIRQALYHSRKSYNLLHNFSL